VVVVMTRPPPSAVGGHDSRTDAVEEYRRSTTGGGRLGRVIAGTVLSGLCVYLLAFPTAAVVLGAIVAGLVAVVAVPLGLMALLGAGSVRARRRGHTPWRERAKRPQPTDAAAAEVDP
jgi:hypothetical protein